MVLLSYLLSNSLWGRSSSGNHSQLRSKKQKKGIVDAVENNPLIRINSLFDTTGCKILAKVEFLNPGGSVKDRVVVKIIEEALDFGELVRGGVVIEGSTGSTTIHLAIIAPAYGCKFHVVILGDVASEKSQILEALGATVERVRPVSITHKDHYVISCQEKSYKSQGISNETKKIDQVDIKQINGQESEKGKLSESVFSSDCKGGFFAD